MNILMIGNGFDLEHDLPTSYPAFLKFVANFRKAYKVANDIPKRLDDIDHFVRMGKLNDTKILPTEE